MSDNVLRVVPNSDELWKGIGGHFDSLGEILCEFIDNSISNFTANDVIGRTVAIYIEEIDKNGFEVTVEDSGTGIKNLESAFTLGSRACAESPLNEHGFGFKHALATANPENNHWSIKTCTEEMAEKNEYCMISAPYSIDGIPCKVCSGLWSKGKAKTGTSISFRCSKDLFKTITRGLQGNYSAAVSIIEVLRESLGYTYSGVIKEQGLNIMTIFRAKGEKDDVNVVSSVDPNWQDFVDRKNKNKLAMTEKYDLGSGIVDIEYTFGRVSVSEKTRKYYKANLASSGVEIRINGRVIESNLFKSIWNRENHPCYNQFLGVINLKSDCSDRLPKTKTSKNGFREGDSKLSELFAWITSKLPADRIPKNDTPDPDDVTEPGLFKKLQALKESQLSMVNPTINTELHAYATLDEKIRIDMYVSVGGKVWIYEGKKDKTKVLDVYQLIMYWDGYVYDNNKNGKSPTEAILLASDHPEAVRRVVEEINRERRDALGNQYKITLKTWKDESIEWPLN